MIIRRRSLLIGLGSLFAAPAIVRASALMPVKVMLDDPLICGIRWQSWPWGLPHPSEMAQGTIGPWYGPVVLKPTSHFLKDLEWHRTHWPNLVWEPLSIQKQSEGQS